MKLFFLAATIGLYLVVAGCSSKSVESDPGTPTIEQDLIQLNALPTPAGVDRAVFAQLKEALRKELARGASAAGHGLDVDDLTVSVNGTDATLQWTYRSSGDYDQNSEVNLADLAPLGLYFRATPASANWAAAQVANGDKNNEVNIADVTPIGANFRVQVLGYRVECTLTPGIEASWVQVGTVPFSASSIPAGQVWRRFEFVDNTYVPGMQYRVIANWTVPTAPNQPPLAAFGGDVLSGPSPLTVNFDATPSDDPDGSIAKYEWDWEGDGAYDVDNGTDPLVQITYTSATPRTFDATLRVTDNQGLTDTHVVQITITADGGFVEPPVETFVDYSDPGDSVEEFWLKNCYAVLPPWQDADRVFQSATFRDWADEVLALTNQECVNDGLAPLSWDPHLELVAQAHARDMALRQYFDHDTPEGLTPFERLDAVDSAPWSWRAENLFAGITFPVEDSPAYAVEGWMNSPGHRANILDPNLEAVGVGVYYHTGDPEGYTGYFVQLFSTFPDDPNGHNWLEPEEVP
jgi:uncharacterized protein YkwD